MRFVFFIFIISLIFFSQAKAGDRIPWTQESFSKSCLTNNDKIIKNVDADQVHLECRHLVNEINSAWFSKKSHALIGWLERTRNSEGVLVKDQEFQANGEIKEQSYFLRSSGASSEAIQNMFVFNANKELLRGNITLGEDTFVIAGPGLIFINGQPITEDVLRKKLLKFYKKGNSKSFYDLIQNIWNSQNMNSPAYQHFEKEKGVQ